MLLAPVTKSPSKIILIFRGGSGIFSKGGGGFSKQNSKTLTPFFKVDQIDFLSSPKALKRRCLGKVFCAAGKLLKKKGQTRFWNFLEILTKSRFCGARSASTEYLLFYMSLLNNWSVKIQLFSFSF